MARSGLEGHLDCGIFLVSDQLELTIFGDVVVGAVENEGFDDEPFDVGSRCLFVLVDTGDGSLFVSNRNVDEIFGIEFLRDIGDAVGSIFGEED